MAEIIERNYLLVGFSAWLIVLPLALTSFALAQRRLGRRWKQLHQWVYLAVLLGAIHFYWSVKSDVVEPLFYLALTLFLLALRWRTLTRWLRR